MSGLLAVWDQGNVQEPQSLGFGGTRYEVVLPGGHTSIRIVFAAYKDSIVALDMWQQAQYTPAVLDRLAEIWGNVARREADGIRYEYRNPGGLGRLQDAVSQELGSWEIEAPAQHQQAYTVLTNPLEKYDYGTFCYFAGVPPAGRKAIQRLLADPASDVIRAVLRSTNPEARVYAVEAMLELERSGASISEVDRRAMKKIVELQIPISVCDGCLVYQSTAKEILIRAGHK